MPLQHFAGGRAVYAAVLKFMPAKLRGYSAPRIFAGYAVAVGKAVAKAEYLHRFSLFQEHDTEAGTDKVFGLVVLFRAVLVRRAFVV